MDACLHAFLSHFIFSFAFFSTLKEIYVSCACVFSLMKKIYVYASFYPYVFLLTKTENKNVSSCDETSLSFSSKISISSENLPFYTLSLLFSYCTLSFTPSLKTFFYLFLKVYFQLQVLHQDQDQFNPDFD